MDRAGSCRIELQVLFDVTTALTGAITLETAAPQLLAAIGRGLESSLATLWQVEPDAHALQSVGVWTASDITMPDVEPATRSKRFGRGEGHLGRVWATGDARWLEDWSREDATGSVGAEIAARAGLRSMLLYPVSSGEKVVGILELFRRDPWPPNGEFARTLTILGSQIGEYIERINAEQSLLRAEKQFREELEQKLVERTADLHRELAIRTKLQSVLHDSQAKLRRLYESDIIGITVADKHGRLKEANDAVLRMLGFTREDVDAGALRWDRLTPPDWRERDQKGIEQLLQAGKVETYEKELFHKDGSRVPLLVGSALLEGSEPDWECICFVFDNTARKRAEEALARLNQDLERRVQERTESLRASEARAAQTAQALARSEQELRLLATHLETIREAERTRLAREIHDLLGQELTGLKMDVAWVVRRLTQSAQPNGDQPKREGVIDRLESMLLQIDSTIGTVRRIATELRPRALDDLGLTAAMEGHARDFQARSGIAIDLAFSPDDVAVDPGRATAIFRIFQELLTNVARHAGAHHVFAALRLEDEALVLDVRDDGKGIAGAQVSSWSSLGLLGVRERALVFGGECSVSGSPGMGTHAKVRIPLASQVGNP